MHRIPAMLLALVFSFLLIAPGSYVSADSQLPACCRIHGAHRCAMGAAGHDTDGGGGPAVRAVCPFARQHSSGWSGVNRLTVPATTATVFAELASHPAVRPQVNAGYRISWLRSRQKRGPPALLS